MQILKDLDLALQVLHWLVVASPTVLIDAGLQAAIVWTKIYVYTVCTLSLGRVGVHMEHMTVKGDIAKYFRSRTYYMKKKRLE